MAVVRSMMLVALVVGFLVVALAQDDDVALSRGTTGAGGNDSFPGSTYEEWVAQMSVYAEESTLRLEQSGLGGSMHLPKGRTIVVDKSGKGNFRTVQRAIDSVPKGNKKRITIVIRPGVYREKIRIIKQKPFITFRCSGRKTVLVWGDTAKKAGGTSRSASTAVESDGFIASHCTFANSAPAPPGRAVGKQAVALRIEGDRAAFYRCKFLGAQDTLYDKCGRHYFRSCHIQGSIDFIFGNGQSLYHLCKITSIARRNSGSITAQKRGSKMSQTGFVFLRCNIGGTGSIYLGRAWGSHSRVVFIHCRMAKMVLPIGWDDSRRQKTVFYAEHRCTGPGSKRNMRAPWSVELTGRQARPFSSIRWIDGQRWL